MDLTARTRDLLADDFVVGGEITANDDTLQATVAVQPPVGQIVSTGFQYTAETPPDVEALAFDLAAGAVLEAKHADRDVAKAAR